MKIPFFTHVFLIAVPVLLAAAAVLAYFLGKGHESE